MSGWVAPHEEGARRRAPRLPERLHDARMRNLRILGHQGQLVMTGRCGDRPVKGIFVRQRDLNRVGSDRRIDRQHREAACDFSQRTRKARDELDFPPRAQHRDLQKRDVGERDRVFGFSLQGFATTSLSCSLASSSHTAAWVSSRYFTATASNPRPPCQTRRARVLSSECCSTMLHTILRPSAAPPSE